MRHFIQLLGFAAAASSCVVGCRPGERKLEPVDVYTQYHGVTFVDKFKIWATGPDELITRDAFFEADNYIYDGSAVHLTALRGETEAFQLVVNADYGNVNDVELEVGALVGPGGAQIGVDRISIYYEYYLTVETASDYRGRTGDVPDALPPLAEPFDLAKGQAQPLFVLVEIPADTKAGKYVGDITVTAKKAEPQTLKLEVDVLAEALEPSLRPPAFLEPDYRAVAAWEERKPELPVKKDKLRLYLELLSSRGVSPLDGGYSQRRLTKSAKRATGDWAEAARATRPTFFYLSPTAEDEKPDLDEMAEEYRTLYGAFGDEKPTAPVIWAAFDGGAPSPFEEGASPAAWWSDLRKAASAWPGKPALAAATSPYRGAPAALLAGAVSYWLPTFHDVAVCPERYQNLRRGHQYFIRVDGSGGDVLDGRRAGPRLISWYGYVWGAEGLAALAPPADAVRPRNPWLDDPMAGTAAAFGNGLGTWFYPGGPAGVEKPVSSVRLELLRQGLEDWALFKMVEKKRGRDYVRERLQSLLPYAVNDLADVSARDLGNNQIFELRQALLAELGGGPPAGRRADAAGRVADAKGNPIYHARVASGAFATYTGEDGSYSLRFKGGRGVLEVSAPGFRSGETRGGGVTLYRRLKGLLPLFDFEAGIDAAFWLSGDQSDALVVSEELDVVHEGKVALAAEFPFGRIGRIVNLYPRLKDFSKHHRLEFGAYNPNDFIVDMWLLLLDDETLDIGRQFRRRISLRPRAWTRVSYRIKDLPRSGEPRLEIKRDGSCVVKGAYRPDLTRIVGVGFEADGLVAYGGRENAESYKIIIDDVKLIVFE
jgi:hypothetical protein